MKLIMENWRNYLAEQEFPSGAYRTFVSPSSGREKMQIQMSVPSKSGDYPVSPVPKNKWGNLPLCKCFEDYLAIIKKAVTGTDIPVNAIYAILEIEGSKGKKDKISTNKDGSKDVGIAQINDLHVDKNLRGTSEDWRKNPEKSIKYATGLLQTFWDSADRKLQISSDGPDQPRDLLLQLAFAGYNGGYEAQKYFIKKNIKDTSKGMSQHGSNKDYMPKAWFYFHAYGGWT